MCNRFNSPRPAWRALLYSALSALIFAPVGCLSAAANAAEITGQVLNRTQELPAPGDVVILLRLEKGMPEESRTVTDAHGGFTFTLQSAGTSYLVRVLHQNVNYDKQASAGEPVSIDVFDAAPKVSGITATIEIIRTGTRGKVLHVSDMLELRNESRPPVTQAGDRSVEMYLPSNAKIDSVLAEGPGKVAVLLSPKPVAAEPGHFAVNFPLRPGATKFAFNYDLPYDGQVAFQTRRAYPLGQLAVMLPPTMKFASRSPAFHLLATGNTRYQVHAANRLRAGKGPAFDVSGAGELPSLIDQPKAAVTSQHDVSLEPSAAPARAVALSVPPTALPRDPSAPQLYDRAETIALSMLTALLLAACAGLVWRARNFHR